MKIFSCIIILQSLDGYRLSFIDDSKDLFWRKIEGTEIQYEERTFLTKKEIKEWFGKSKVFLTKELVWHEAMQIYREQINLGKKFIKPNEIRLILGHEQEEF